MTKPPYNVVRQNQHPEDAEFEWMTDMFFWKILRTDPADVEQIIGDICLRFVWLGGQVVFVSAGWPVGTDYTKAVGEVNEFLQDKVVDPAKFMADHLALLVERAAKEVFL